MRTTPRPEDGRRIRCSEQCASCALRCRGVRARQEAVPGRDDPAPDSLQEQCASCALRLMQNGSYETPETYVGEVAERPKAIAC